jgi:hypothetical protein
MHTGTRELLELWERGVTAPRWDRAEALLSASNPAACATLGARNSALLALRSRLFGSVQMLRCNCAACGATTEFGIDCAVLARELLPPPDATGLHTLDEEGFCIEFRVPLAADVRSAAGRARAAEDFVRILFERCITRIERDGVACDPDTLPLAVSEALSRRLEALEPGAVVSFELTCPECQACWRARMDCADVLWSEVQSRAERVLLDVDALARAYGWTEEDVLALTPIRRAAYLQLVGDAG